MAMQFLLEGQEEIGSPNLAELLQDNAKLLKADIALSADGGQISPEHVRWRPCILALACATRYTAKPPATDLALSTMDAR